MKSHHSDQMLLRMEKQAAILGDTSAFEPPKYIGRDAAGNPVRLPRWRIDARYIEFECGCRAERFKELKMPQKTFDPIIFDGLPEQAVYDYVCEKHTASMNDRLRLGGFGSFRSWHESRRKLLLGK